MFIERGLVTLIYFQFDIKAIRNENNNVSDCLLLV